MITLMTVVSNESGQGSCKFRTGTVRLTYGPDLAPLYRHATCSGFVAISLEQSST